MENNNHICMSDVDTLTLNNPDVFQLLIDVISVRF